MPLLTTKLYVPPPRPNLVARPRLLERLNEGLYRKLTLISAPAGFGKTTLATAWIDGCSRPAAWLSLYEGDNDPARFLTYLVAALQTIAADVGQGVLGALQSPQPPPPESILTALLNEIATIPDDFVLVLDDYHVIDAEPVDGALAFLIEHLPPHAHLVVATREDPHVPLPRLRARGHLTELRVADLRFTPDEAAGFLNGVMGLGLSPKDVAALETCTEGWIAGLQLAALSMRGRDDAGTFIASFTGSHRFVMDYLVEEVLVRQPRYVQTFLLRTAILERLCWPYGASTGRRRRGQHGPPREGGVPAQLGALASITLLYSAAMIETEPSRRHTDDAALPLARALTRSDAASIHAPRLNAIAGTGLKAAAACWFIVAVAGQWLFVYYVTAFYGGALVEANPERWNDVLVGGYVPGGAIGNVVLAAHLLLAVIITVGGPLQIVPQIRNRFLAFHRWNGHVFIPVAFLIALTGLYSGWTRGTAGDAVLLAGISVNGVLIMIFAALALFNALARDIVRHRRWALRLFMVVGGVWFFRVGLMFWIIVNQGPAGFDPETFTGPFLTFLAFGSYLLPLAVLEGYLRVKARGSARSKLMMAALLMVLTLATGVGIFGATTFMWLPRLH